GGQQCHHVLAHVEAVGGGRRRQQRARLRGTGGTGPEQLLGAQHLGRGAAAVGRVPQPHHSVGASFAGGRIVQLAADPVLRLRVTVARRGQQQLPGACRGDAERRIDGGGESHQVAGGRVAAVGGRTRTAEDVAAGQGAAVAGGEQQLRL